MAARGRKGASRGRRRSRRQPSVMPWAIGGLLLGLLLSSLVWLYLQAPDADRPAVATKPLVTVEQLTQPNPSPAETVIDIPAPKKSPYDFYQELKNQQVVVPQDEIRDRNGDTGPVLIDTPATAHKKGYILQVGSFRKARQADELKARLALLGLTARIEKVKVSDGVFHRVRLGPFDSLEQTNQLRSRLLAQKIKSILIKVGQ